MRYHTTISSSIRMAADWLVLLDDIIDALA